MAGVGEVVSEGALGQEGQRAFDRKLSESRCMLQEYGVRGMDPEKLTEMLSKSLGGMGVGLRSVVCRDAARIELTDRDSGYTRRYDWEGPDPLAKLLECKLLMPTVRIDPVLDRDFNIGDAGYSGSASLTDRLAYLREAAEPFSYDMELRTRQFKDALRDVSRKAGLGFGLRYGMPEVCGGGRTPYGRSCTAQLEVTDLKSGGSLWNNGVLVVEDGTDAARMLSVRRAFESAGLFGTIPAEDGERRSQVQKSGIDWTGASYLRAMSEMT